MKFFARMTALALAGVMSLCLLAGCQNQGNSSASDSSGDNVPEVVDVAAIDDICLYLSGLSADEVIATAATELKKGESASAGQAAATTASALLRGARGNSGVILSLFFRGIAKAWKDVENADCDEVIQGFKVSIFDTVNDQGEDPVSRDELLESLSPEVIQVSPGGAFALWYGSDLFIGQAARIMGTLEKGPADARLED